jgi:hypothetical protein
MGNLLCQCSYKLLRPLDCLDGLALADPFRSIVGIQSELEDSIEMLPEQGRIELASSD